MTITGTTDYVAIDVEETAAGLALAAGLDAVARVYDEALDAIARLARTWDSADDDDHRVLRMAERPTVNLRVQSAAA